MKLLLFATLIGLLTRISYHDIRTRLIPNSLILLILFIGIGYQFGYGSPIEAITGLLIPALPLLLIMNQLRSIGAGDIKLIAVVGVWFGGLLNIAIYLLACCTALLYVGIHYLVRRKLMNSVPFGVYYAIGTVSIIGASMVVQ